MKAEIQKKEKAEICEIYIILICEISPLEMSWRRLSTSILPFANEEEMKIFRGKYI